MATEIRLVFDGTANFCNCLAAVTSHTGSLRAPSAMWGRVCAALMGAHNMRTWQRVGLENLGSLAEELETIAKYCVPFEGEIHPQRASVTPLGVITTPGGVDFEFSGFPDDGKLIVAVAFNRDSAYLAANMLLSAITEHSSALHWEQLAAVAANAATKFTG